MNLVVPYNQDLKMRLLPDDIIIGLQIPVGAIDDIVFDIKTGLRNERH